MQIDVLITDTTPSRARTLLKNVHTGAEKAGIDARMTTRGVRPHSWVFLYGLGGPDRVQYRSQKKVVAFDMGYWCRNNPGRHYRVSVGGLHSPELIFRGDRPTPERWEKAKLSVTDSAKIRPAIMLVGNGPKSTAIGAQGWAAAKSREIRAIFPGRQIVYRPKPKRPLEPGVVSNVISREPIEQALRTVGLVVCRHSNVAVDACLQGVPVVSEDGAGAAIYPRSLQDYQNQPSLEKRIEFLHRLAWWQWTSEECEGPEFWRWMKGVIDED